MNNTLKVAIAQMVMETSPEENARCILALHSKAADEKAHILVTPELSLSGFHRGVPGLCGSQTLAKSKRKCHQHNRTDTLLALGVPFENNGEILNRYDIMAGNECRLTQDKIGLTESERRLFTAGKTRHIEEIQGWRTAVIMCREILDTTQHNALSGHVDLILWPGYIQWDQGTDPYEDCAKTLAHSLNAWIVQCNWATASNDPNIKGMGQSLLISPEGRIHASAESDQQQLLISEIQKPYST